MFGADSIESGRIELDGREVAVSSPQRAIESGIGYLTEDRKGEGLALQLGVDKNITLANLPASFGFIDLGAERRVAERQRERLDIRTPSIRRAVRMLSGGNQQKVVVARWLGDEGAGAVLRRAHPRCGRGCQGGDLPTHRGLAEEGRAIVLISSYLPELLNMCDRILVMRGKRVGRATA